MKKVIPIILVSFIAELILSIIMITGISEKKQDIVAMNECLKSVEASFGKEEDYVNSLPYAVIDLNGDLLYRNDTGVSVSVNDAIKNNDTVMDIVKDGSVIGKMIFKNNSDDLLEKTKLHLIIVIAVFTLIQAAVVIGCFIYLSRNVLEPFDKLSAFAVRVAGGNLEIPLEADKKHIFGSFTEAFDLMREELRKAKTAEKKANDDKKEMIAKLSHDIKTPVASIKSSSDIGYELTKEDRSKEYFRIINEKSDQIKSLTDNLFNNAVKDITELSVSASPASSRIVGDLIRNADHMLKAGSVNVPECSVFIDRLRLQQTFDNLFMNSYKYADTPIEVSAEISDGYLMISISDHGPGVKKEEIPLLKEKYKRGSNTAGKEGAGLGLYLADHFLTEMDGKLELAGENGFTAKVFLRTIDV
ncbi:MAG: HAMP domain-containing histidine kinase [Lachnospiraceae bacterium]|nr:HAMP domain-containing histidine kinase [Lachnospiraceae bacterium]